MSYETQLTVFDMRTGATPLSVTGTLWEIWKEFDSANRQHEREVPQETKPFANGRLSFMSGPNFLDPNNHSIAISVEDTTLPGKIFRSGQFPNNLPAGASTPGGPVPASGVIEVLVADSVSFKVADINAMLPATPMTVPIGISGAPPATITGITATPGAGFMTVVATATYPVPALVTFTYTITLNFAITTSEWHIDRVFDVYQSGSSVTVTSTGSFGSTIEAAILSAFDGVIASIITPGIVGRISAGLNSAAISAAAKAAGKATGTGATTLPPGVVLSVVNMTITASGVGAVPGLGAYGGLLSKLFPSIGTGGGPGCMLLALASVYGAHLNLAAFRYFRDTTLAGTLLGRWFTRLYYRHGPWLTKFLASQPRIRARVVALFEGINPALERRRNFSAG